ADAEVNNAFINPMLSPPSVAIGKFNNIVPIKIKLPNPNVSILGGFNSNLLRLFNILPINTTPNYEYKLSISQLTLCINKKIKVPLLELLFLVALCYFY
ncbi:MAG TPA: hypothetical protein VJZ99_01610, partial [Patescibacteria group bacterium]|nr:hypothetical protein [Patescibacteria group bacterium]